MPTETGLRSAAESVVLDWDAVCAHLAAHGHRLDLDPPPRQFEGGLANLNYLIHLDGQPAVLRRPPMGDLPPGAYDMAREFRILSRLPDALPFIARGLYFCDDPTVIGQRFQIIEYRPGLVIREHLPANLAHRPEIGVRLSQVLLETIAAIHAVDTKTVGLDDLGRPDGFLERGVAGWRKRGLAAMQDGTETLHQQVGHWLETNIVPDGPPGLLHNDFKLNNIILNPDDLSPRAVVDWDQGTRGDPLFDFATLLSYWVHPDDPPALHDMEQMPAVEACLCPRQQAVAEYARISGRDMSDFVFHRVLAMYKLAVIFLQLGLRYRTGVTQEARYAPLTGIGTGILEFSHEIAQGSAF
ncbi:phosphotransferase family protein [Rhodopila sp.]|uniref:phosphotransferase family protein n=1 Tax=Rhodopila sp. TaxID=2480087 RepID=UPI003D14361B